jgi:hypothetical protein
MSGGKQSLVPLHNGTVPLRILAVALVSFVITAPTAAQVHGVPPSVTSIQFHVPPFLPNIMPSVTSLGPSGYAYRAGPIPPPYGIPNHPFHNFGRRNGRGSYGYGGGYAVPYYVPAYDTSAGYDSGGGGGPYLYSGPPAEQTLHIVVDTPRANREAMADDEDPAPIATSRSNHAIDARPIDPTVLVFRDGHQQEVSNYAIMGQTVYVFDDHKQKIALGDLDVPATIKANDDRGVEFQLPNPKAS